MYKDEKFLWLTWGQLTIWLLLDDQMSHQPWQELGSLLRSAILGILKF